MQSEHDKIAAGEKEGEDEGQEVTGLDLWQLVRMPLQPDIAHWTTTLVEGKDPDGSSECFALVSFITPNHIARLWFAEEGLDNLIKFLQATKAEVQTKNGKGIYPLSVAKSQLIIPGMGFPEQPKPSA